MRQISKISLLLLFLLLNSYLSIIVAQLDDKTREDGKEIRDSIGDDAKGMDQSPALQSESGIGGVLNLRSPNVYALSKYGDIPVNYSTGVPNINIPLMTLTDRGLKLDISLSYHASGIRVDEEAPWTGLGWSLNAGGVITRVIRGDADLPNASSSGVFRQRTVISDYRYSQDFVTYKNQTLPKLQVAETNQTDNNPDIFIFNFAGYSGKFFLDDYLNPIFFEYQDFKVKYNYNASSIDEPYFTITTDDGIIYEFKEMEYIYNRSEGHMDVTAWYLTKMTSPVGGVINFTYRRGGAPSYSYQKREQDVYFMPVSQNASQHYINETVAKMRPVAGASVTSSVLYEIQSSAGNKIEFRQTSSSRLDSEQSRGDILHEITLRDAFNTQQKKYTLHYSYFEASNANKTKSDWGSPMNFLNYRLKLDSLREVSNTNNEFLTHKFEYYYNPNPSINDPYTLPYRLSPSQDHWGYYNYSLNTTIFPNNPAGRWFHADEWYIQFLPNSDMPSTRTCVVTGGGTREPNVEAVKAGSLKKITYPTGGHVTFEYEPHGYNPISLTSAGGIRIKRIQNSNGDIRTYEYSGYSFISSIYPSQRENPYYTLYYQNDLDFGNGRSDLLEAFGVPHSVYYGQPFILKIESRPQAVLGSGPVMIYSRVIERMSGNGRIEYDFSYTDDWNSSSWGDNMDGISLDANFLSGNLTSTSSPGRPEGIYTSIFIDSDTWPFPDKVSTDWKRGHLTAKTIYNESGQQVQKNIIEYDLSALRTIPGYAIAKIKEGTDYVYARSYTVGGQVKVKKETSDQIMPDGSTLKIIKEYDYSSANHKKVTEERTWDSEGKLIKTKYYYPTEYGSLFTTLKNKNILSPVDTRVYRVNQLISGTQIQLDNNGNPLTVYQPEINSGVTDIPFNSSAPFTFNTHTTLTYHSSGLLSSVKPRSEIPVVYLWGYNYQHPIAKIEGVSYSDVTAKIDQTTQNRIAGSAVPATADLNLISNLRETLSGALITTYTYQPLIGMTSITDPRKVTVYYEYDNFGRLKTVRDKDNNILESYEYNIKGM